MNYPVAKKDNRALNQAISEKRAGEVIMLATGAGQESLEDASIGSGHGLFTYYLVDGLAGLADSSGDNKITLTNCNVMLTRMSRSLQKRNTNENRIRSFAVQRMMEKLFPLWIRLTCENG